MKKFKVSWTNILLVVLLVLVSSYTYNFVSGVNALITTEKDLREMHYFLGEKYAAEGWPIAKKFMLVTTGIKTTNMNGQEWHEFGQTYCDSYIVTVAVQEKGFDSLLTLGHEWVHIEQCIQGELLNVDYNIPYPIRPHEIEARDRAIDMVMEYLEYVSNKRQLTEEISTL